MRLLPFVRFPSVSVTVVCERHRRSDLQENNFNCDRLCSITITAKTAPRNDDNMMLSGRIYLIHCSIIHQRNVIRAIKHFITLWLLRTMDPLRGIRDIAVLWHRSADCTCEFFLAAVPHTLLQILQLVFHLLILPLCLLTLSPEQMPHHKHYIAVMKTKSAKEEDSNFINSFGKLVAISP